MVPRAGVEVRSKADPCMEDDPRFYETFYDRPH